MSLRGRLLTAVLLLVAAGLVASDVATWTALRAFLLQRVDQQLGMFRQRTAESILRRGTVGPPSDRRDDPGGAALTPTYVEVRDPAGRTLLVSSADDGPAPRLPDPLPTGAAGDGGMVATFTADARSGATRFRVQAAPLPGGLGTVVVAVPLTDVGQTLGRLLAIELVASIAILALLGALAWRLVQLGLRPLEEVSATAGAIAAGELSRRVRRAEPRTEVGRLGLAFNAMLTQIEAAFAQRRASEARLRQFVADASHELRTPLTSIRGYAELFRRGARSRPADLATAMRRIEDEAERMGVLVDELLLLARLDQGRPLQREPVDLSRLAAEAAQDARVVEPARPITVATPGPVMVAGDEARLRQVAGNLLANARMHTPPDAPVHVRVARDGGVAALEVTDAGPGLTPDQAERVFERFYRTDPARSREKGGAGLGLSIVAAVAQAHGGRAGVSSAPGRGARFRVELPLAPAAGPAAGGQGPADTPAGQAGVEMPTPPRVVAP